MTPKEAADILRNLGMGLVGEEENLKALTLAIEALDPWQPPRAVIPWVDAKDHPRPTDGTRFMYQDRWGNIYSGSAVHIAGPVVRWCLLPEDQS